MEHGKKQMAMLWIRWNKRPNRSENELCNTFVWQVRQRVVQAPVSDLFYIGMDAISYFF
jgi:hypothetical protein